MYSQKAGNSGETRPLGIPSFEDKVLQRAVVMLLEPIYEWDFLDCSYGFRRGRSAHQAVEALWQQSTSIAGGWILELDIRKFFDEIDHANLMTFLKHRLRDSAVLRLIGKWLNAGVMENGNISYPESGSPQGGVISCLLGMTVWVSSYEIICQLRNELLIKSIFNNPRKTIMADLFSHDGFSRIMPTKNWDMIQQVHYTNPNSCEF